MGKTNLTDIERSEMIIDILHELKKQGYWSLGNVWLQRLTDDKLIKKYKEVINNG